MIDRELPPLFDPATYLRINPDVAESGMDPVEHYLRFGITENRRYSEIGIWNKVHLLGVFSAALGLSRYLEITTNLTGRRYSETKVLGLIAKRIVYRLNEPVYDGLPVDYTSPDDDISACLDEIKSKGKRFDLILVDGHHTYDCARRDLEAALNLLDPGGVILVHDCNPLTHEMANPAFVEGLWNGETYRAFLDLCLGNASFDYFTLDLDEGCAIIMKPRSPLEALRNYVRAFRQRPLLARWRARAIDSDSAYEIFAEERSSLLRLGGFPLLRYKLSGAK